MKKLLIIVVVLGAVLMLALGMSIHTQYQASEQTKQLCREYAARDHEKEIAPARYKWLGKAFVDNYDWYTSCINHEAHPTAGR